MSRESVKVVLRKETVRVLVPNCIEYLDLQGKLEEIGADETRSKSERIKDAYRAKLMLAIVNEDGSPRFTDDPAAVEFMASLHMRELNAIINQFNKGMSLSNKALEDTEKN